MTPNTIKYRILAAFLRNTKKHHTPSQASASLSEAGAATRQQAPGPGELGCSDETDLRRLSLRSSELTHFMYHD